MRAKIDPNNTQPQSELSDEMEVMARKAQSKSMTPVIPRRAVWHEMFYFRSIVYPGTVCDTGWGWWSGVRIGLI